MLNEKRTSANAWAGNHLFTESVDNRWITHPPELQTRRTRLLFTGLLKIRSAIVG